MMNTIINYQINQIMDKKKSLVTTGQENLLSGNWSYSLDRRELSICPHGQQMLELDNQGVYEIGALLLSVIVPEQRYLEEDIKQALSSNTGFNRQLEIVTSSGVKKMVRLNAIVSYHAYSWNTPDKIIGTIEDVSHLKNDQSSDLSIIKHEMRTPLTIIKLNLQLTRNMLLKQSIQQADSLLGRADFYVNFMNQLLDNYGNNNKPSTDSSHSIFDLSILVNSVVNEFAIIHPGHRFRSSLHKEVFVKGNKFQIIQVVINYLTNAVNYSPVDSMIKININMQNSLVGVSIRDQGIGIPAGAEEKIFEKFYRGEGQAANGRNKGLGLYLVKEIVNDHGGVVQVVRAKDKGSIFSFFLPVAKRSEQ